MAGMLFGPDYDASVWIERWQTNPPARIAPAFDALTDRDSVAERLGEITCPAVVIHGELDASMPIEKAEALCAGLPGCEQVVVIPGCRSHHCIGEPPGGERGAAVLRREAQLRRR